MPPRGVQTIAVKPKNTKKAVVRLFAYISQYKGILLLALLLSFAGNVAGLIGPGMAGAAIDAASAGAGDDAFGQLRGELEPGQCAWLDGILLGNERSNMSEMPPEAILQGLLRKLWIAAVRRRQGELPAASTPENDLRRLTLSGHARLLQRAPWPRASALMVPATLA